MGLIFLCRTIAQLEEANHEKDDKITNLNHQIEMLKKQLDNHRDVEIREYTPQKEYLSSPKRDEIKNADDRLQNLTQEINKDIDNAYKKIRDLSPANTNATSFNGKMYSPDNSRVQRDYQPGLLNPFNTSSYSTGNLFGSDIKRSPQNDHLHQSPVNIILKHLC